MPASHSWLLLSAEVEGLVNTCSGLNFGLEPVGDQGSSAAARIIKSKVSKLVQFYNKYKIT
jgi:hypothetical protein